MNENQLKALFCSGLRNGHIKGSELIPTNGGEIRIIEEAILLMSVYPIRLLMPS
jgi:hypothetical protein